MLPSTPAPLCQLEELGSGALPLTPGERILRRLRRHALLMRIRLAKAVRRPGWVLRRTAEVLGRGRAAARVRARAAPTPLGLKPGERVRVKSREEIRATLDERYRLEGMAYIPAVMDSFCGRSFTVRKRVTRFFDERNWRMLRVKNAVILDGSFCEPAETLGCEYAGCQRTCFLFWKEGWLERETPE